MANFLTRSRNKKEIAEDWYACTGGGWYEKSPTITSGTFTLTAPIGKSVKSNCQNCGAPYEPVKCSYCGTHH